MRIIKGLILLFVLIYSPMNAQSFIHIGFGGGECGGATASPYKNPFMSFDGYVATMEFEKVIFNNISLSFQASYSNFNKAELFTDEANSEAVYLGVFYNISNKSKQKSLFFEISPLLAIGFESIDWYDNISSFITNNTNVISGIDKMTYLSTGLRGTVGFQISGNLIKLSLTPKYDLVINKNRDIIINTLTGERAIEIENPNFYSGVYVQLNISVGVKLN